VIALTGGLALPLAIGLGAGAGVFGGRLFDDPDDLGGAVQGGLEAGVIGYVGGALLEGAWSAAYAWLLQRGNSACFVAGTPIRLADGSLKAIEKVKQGDRVLTRDPESGEQGPGAVSRAFVRQSHRIYRLELNDGRVIRTTGEHPFWVEGKGFVKCKRLARSDLLSDEDDEPVGIARITAEDGRVRVYNFEVAGTHTYFAGGVWVHNACGGKGQELVSFTYRNFRKNLGRLTGGVPDAMDAHHVFPNKFIDEFKEIGININDPHLGAWWDAADHRRKAYEYNKVWEEFFKGQGNAEQAFDKARELAGKYDFSLNF